MNSVHHPSQNHLLAELQETEFSRLSPYLELIRMSRGDVLYQSGSDMTHLYFPTTAIISIDYILENGGTSEIASVGNEGLIGIALFMGGRSTPNRALVQTAGHAYRLRAARLLEEFYRKGPVLRLLLRYTQALMTQMAQAAVCNGHHSTEQRLCRWLLQTLDRSNGGSFLGTQEAIGAILGVRHHRRCRPAATHGFDPLPPWPRHGIESPRSRASGMRMLWRAAARVDAPVTGYPPRKAGHRALLAPARRAAHAAPRERRTPQHPRTLDRRPRRRRYPNVIPVRLTARHFIPPHNQRRSLMNHPALATSDQPIPAPPPTTPSKQHDEQALDEALKESFPASAPIAAADQRA